MEILSTSTTDFAGRKFLAAPAVFDHQNDTPWWDNKTGGITL